MQCSEQEGSGSDRLVLCTMYVRLNGDSKLAINVSIYGYLSLYVIPGSPKCQLGEAPDTSDPELNKVGIDDGWIINLTASFFLGVWSHMASPFSFELSHWLDNYMEKT